MKCPIYFAVKQQFVLGDYHISPSLLLNCSAGVTTFCYLQSQWYMWYYTHLITDI